MERIGRQLALHVPGQVPAWSFELIAGDTNQVHEPLAFPGGFIFVPAALLAAAEDEQEFAGMLAHAMVHVAERHQVPIRGSNNIALIWTGSGALVPVGLLKTVRAHELEADLSATQVIAKAGYDPGALARYLRRVQVDPTGRGKEFSALPLRDARLASLASILPKLPEQWHSSGDDFQKVHEEVRRGMAKEKPVRVPTLRR